MEMVPLKASARPAGQKASALRKTSAVPCIVYGRGLKQNLQVTCKNMDLHKAFVKAGESTVVDLDIDGNHIPVLFKDIVFDPVSSKEIHADLLAIDMKKEIETIVPIHFEGESPAVKSLGAIFVTAHDHVRVRCLPANLPHALNVSITALHSFHDSVSIKDIVLPRGVTVLEKSDTVLATVQEPRKEEVIVPVAAAPVEGAETSAEGEIPKEGATEGAAPAASSKEKPVQDKK